MLLTAALHSDLLMRVTTQIPPANYRTHQHQVYGRRGNIDASTLFSQYEN